MSADDLLVVEDVRKGFGRDEILRGISLAVPPQAFVSVIGRSGCGKTTLLRVIAGLERPDEGVVRLGNRTLDGEGSHVPPQRRGIAYVSQEGTLFPHLTALENVAFGLSGKDRLSEAASLIDLVGLAGMENRSPDQLSGGQQQRVALARALAVRPRLLLLDEPFAAVDLQLRSGLRSTLKSLMSELGMTTILVTQDVDEALTLSDEVAMMRDGRFVQRGEPQTVYENPVDPAVAWFFGHVNLIEGMAAHSHIFTAVGKLDLAESIVCDRAVASIRPDQIEIFPPDAGSRMARVRDVAYGGSTTVTALTVEGDDGRHTKLVARTLGPPGWAGTDLVGIRFMGRMHAWSGTLETFGLAPDRSVTAQEDDGPSLGIAAA